MKKILITGIGGFVGSHLTDLLLRDSTINIAGIIHPDYPSLALEANSRVSIYKEDMLNGPGVSKLVQEIRPDAVYHLAGMAHVHESWKNRKETIETNFIGSFHVLEACRALPHFPPVLLVGSAETYGIVPEKQQPITEEHSLFPSSPYAVSKIAQETLGLEYANIENHPVYLSRSFNHTGPRQKESFVCSSFARQIAQAERGELSEIRVGNLSPRRDFSDVRDVCLAYCTILEKGRPGIPYNVCSGSAVSIQEVLDILLSYSRVKLNVITDSNKFRPSDMTLLLGSYARLEKHTGWAPSYNIRMTLLDLLNYWRAELSGSNS